VDPGFLDQGDEKAETEDRRGLKAKTPSRQCVSRRRWPIWSSATRWSTRRGHSIPELTPRLGRKRRSTSCTASFLRGGARGVLARLAAENLQHRRAAKSVQLHLHARRRRDHNLHEWRGRWSSPMVPRQGAPSPTMTGGFIRNGVRRRLFANADAHARCIHRHRPVEHRS
jgi:hypothetical protein